METVAVNSLLYSQPSFSFVLITSVFGREVGAPWTGRQPIADRGIRPEGTRLHGHAFWHH